MNNFIRIIIVAVIASIPSKAISQKIITIDEAIKTALQNNQQIKSAEYNIQKEEAVKLKVVNVPKPELFIEYEGINGLIDNFESRKIGIVQEFDFPSSYFFRSNVQSSQVLVAKEELNKLVNELKFKVKQSYYNLLLQIKLLEIAKENFKIYNDFLFVAERKYDVGSTSNLEVLEAKVNQIKFENEFKNIESNIRVSKSELIKLMNVDYSFEPKGDLAYKDLSLNKNSLLKNALINNPELNIIRFQKEKSLNQISLTKSELLPNISLRYYNQKIGKENGFWGFEVGFGIPLWFWWEQTGKIKEANMEYKISSSDEINAKKLIEAEVNLSYEDYENSLRQLKFFSDEALRVSEEILRQAKLSYETGNIGYVEYLQALTITYETKIQYLHSIYIYINSIIKLEKITSGDIK